MRKTSLQGFVWAGGLKPAPTECVLNVGFAGSPKGEQALLACCATE